MYGNKQQLYSVVSDCTLDEPRRNCFKIVPRLIKRCGISICDLFMRFGREMCSLALWLASFWVNPKVQFDATNTRTGLENIMPYAYCIIYHWNTAAV